MQKLIVLIKNKFLKNQSLFLVYSFSASFSFDGFAESFLNHDIKHASFLFIAAEPNVT